MSVPLGERDYINNMRERKKWRVKVVPVEVVMGTKWRQVGFCGARGREKKKHNSHKLADARMITL